MIQAIKAYIDNLIRCNPDWENLDYVIEYDRMTSENAIEELLLISGLLRLATCAAYSDASVNLRINGGKLFFEAELLAISKLAPTFIGFFDGEISS